MTLQQMEKLQCALNQLRKENFDRFRLSNKLRKLAEDAQITKGWVMRFWKNKNALGKQISREKERLRENVRMQLFLESSRLFSMPYRDFIPFMSAAMPELAPFKMGNKKKGIFSDRTYRNRIYKLYGYEGMKTRDLYSNEKIGNAVKSNLIEWEPITLGVHTVRIVWKKRINSSTSQAGRPVTSKEDGLLLMIANRSMPLDQRVSLHILKDSESEEKIAEKIEKTINRLSNMDQIKSVRLTTTMEGETKKPVAVSKEILESKLKNLKVEEDIPTLSTGPIFLEKSYNSSKQVKKHFNDFFGKLVK